MDAKQKATLRRRLLPWFDRHQRDLPWRKNRTPYRIWVSEIMLQQTQVATVIDYYRRFLKRFPSVRKLAAADESEVLKLWEGLGYYRRARQLHAAARVVMEQHRGRFPMTFEEVLALPGIGRYTAGAILSISRDQRLPILEGNTIRLFARLTGLKSDPKTAANQKRLWEFSESLLPSSRVGDFNQALMELGSEICTPKQPACHECPLMDVCPTFLHGWQERIPATGKKIAYEDIRESVILVRRRGKYLVRQCGSGERWAGLWDFPRFRSDVSDRRQLQEQLFQQFGLKAELRQTSETIRHAVTRFKITLDCWTANSISGRLQSEDAVAWKTRKEIAGLPMSVTGRKIADRLSRPVQWRLIDS